MDNYDAWNLNNFSLEGLLFSLSPLKERSVAPSATFLLTAGGCENWRPSASTTPWIAIAWRPSGHLGRVYRLASRPDLFIYILLTVGRCILFLHLAYTCQHYLHKLTARGRSPPEGVGVCSLLIRRSPTLRPAATILPTHIKHIFSCYDFSIQHLLRYLAVSPCLHNKVLCSCILHSKQCCQGKFVFPSGHIATTMS